MRDGPIFQDSEDSTGRTLGRIDSRVKTKYGQVRKGE